MTFSVGQQCKTRDGRDARVVCVDVIGKPAKIVALIRHETHEAILGLYADGRFSRDGPCESDLLPPKRSGTVWVNVYDGGFAGFGARDFADNAVMEDGRQASEVRLACIEVQWEEGDGLP